MTDQPIQTKSLAEALALLQGRLPEVKKTEKAVVGNYSYDYAGLPAISRELLPLLGELGLSFSCRPTLSGDRFVLQFELLHVSGESRTGEYPLPSGGTPQQTGSAVTYARRYTLCAVTGLVAETDDDGAAASHQDRPAQRRTARKAAPPARQTQDDPGLISPEAVKAIQAGFTELGYRKEDRDERIRIIRSVSGEDVQSTSGLTREGGRKVLDGIARKRAEAQRQEPAE